LLALIRAPTGCAVIDTRIENTMPSLIPASFEPTWGKNYSAYDPNKPVNPKRAKEIFPQDFINIFVQMITSETTAKVARVITKDMAKKNGGKAGLHDLFLERPLDLAKQLTARQIKNAETLIQKLRQDCANHVAYVEHRRRISFGAAIRIGTYVRGYCARRLARKRRLKKEKRERDDRAQTKIATLVRRVQGGSRFEELKCRAYLWQRRGHDMRYLERAIVQSTRHVRNDSNEKRISYILALEGSTRWNQILIGATVTGETAPNLIDPSHPEGGSIHYGETAVLFAHYGIMASGGRRAPVVICRVDMKPLTQLEESRLAAKRAAAEASDPFGSSKKRGQGRSKKGSPKSRGRGKIGRKKKSAKASSTSPEVADGSAAVVKKEDIDIVKVPLIQPFHDSTSPIQYIQMILSGQNALPSSFGGWKGERLRRNEREEFYVLQHMSGFLGRDLVRYLASRRELPALASPDGTGQDGQWAKDRRRKYWETTNIRHGCIAPYRRRVHSVRDEKYKTETAQRVIDYKKSNYIPHFWDSTAKSNAWRLIFFQDDGVLNCEDSFCGGNVQYQTRINSQTGQKTSSMYNIKTDPYTLNPEMVERLVSLCNEVGAKLICCSNRRESYELRDHLTETLQNAGLPSTSFLGFTPKIDIPAGRSSGGSSNRLASIYSWLLEQDPRRVIESWVIVDKIDMIKGDGRDRVMIVNGSKLSATAKEKHALETYNRAVEKGWAGENLDLKKHFVRTHMRRGLNEERGAELRRLLLLPKLTTMLDLESDLILNKGSFEERANAFIEGMPQEGPFVPGLKTKEANRRFVLFLKVFTELVQTMDYLDVHFKKLRHIVDGDAFLTSNFKWDSGKHRKVRSIYNQLNDANDKLMSAKRAQELRQREVSCLKKGGRFCPRCEKLVFVPPDFQTNAESNKWLSCTNSKCLYEFCQRCGAEKGPIVAHGVHRHLFGCQFHKKLKPGVKDGPKRYWSAAATEVKRGQRKAGDVRCNNCCEMPLETESCPSPENLPSCWRKEKDPDPKLRRIRNALEEKARNDKAAME
jgi:hypothetical protein